MATKSELVSKAQALFDEGYACSQSVLLAYADIFGVDARVAKLIASTFGGGMGRLRQKCGAVTGGFMVLGLAYGNEDPADMETKLNSYRKVRELNSVVEEKHGSTICLDLLKKHATESEVKERKHHNLFCRDMVADLAGMVYDILNADNKIGG